jgi:hypothetical protein
LHRKGRRVEWTAGETDSGQDRDRRRHPRVVQIGALHVGDQPAQINRLPKPPQIVKTDRMTCVIK